MRSFTGIALGVLIGLVTAVAPFHFVNLAFCAGLIVAGYVAVLVAGGTSGEMESVQGLRIGLWVGVLVAVLSLGLNLLLSAGLETPPLLFDAMPPVITAFIERFFAGFRGLISGGFNVPPLGVSLVQRFVYGLLLLPLFSAVGGIMGASMFRRQPPVTPDRSQEVPVSPF